MGQAPDKERVDHEPIASAAREAPGRVEFDSRGNSVWRWAKDVLESTSVLLKRLEVKDLALEPTQKVPVMGGDKPGQKKPASRGAESSVDDKDKSRHPAARRDRRDTDGGFDPYNSR